MVCKTWAKTWTASQLTGFSRFLSFKWRQKYQALYCENKENHYTVQVCCVLLYRNLFFKEKIDLVAWFLCSTSFNTFPIYFHYTYGPQKMVTSCRMCIKYDIIKGHALGCTWSIRHIYWLSKTFISSEVCRCIFISIVYIIHSVCG